MAQGLYTFEDFMKLPEERHVELIAGELVREPSPGGRHQEVSWQITYVILQHIRRRPGLGMAWQDRTVRLDDRTAVEPDVCFVSGDRLGIVRDTHLDEAPDLVVEIASPGMARRDRIEKRALYEKHGVREYWIVSLEPEAVQVIDFREGRDGVYRRGETFRSEVLGADIEVAALFSTWWKGEP